MTETSDSTDSTLSDREPPVRAADAAAIATMSEVVSVHVNRTHWWNNASFVLPLLVAMLSIAIGAIFSVGEATGFGLFALAVTALLLPIVAAMWRRTATAVVLTGEAVIALHQGRELRSVRWDELDRIEPADYASVQWRLRARDGSHLSIEAELHDVDGLIDSASELSGLPRDVRSAG